MNSENYFMNQDSKLTLGLSILFVDIEFGRGRLEYDQHSRFFLSDSNFWQQFQRFAVFESYTGRILPHNFDDILRLHGMGYLHVLERGKKWNNLAKTEQTETINRFKATVSRLRPALVVISGKENYKRLFSDTVATSRSIADGLMDAEIFWDEELNRSSKVFMIRKTSFRTDRERKVVWVQLRNLVRELRRLKIRYDVVHPMNQPREIALDKLTQLAVDFEHYFYHHK